MTKNNLAEGIEHLLAIISSNRFLSRQGLGNEVPFFICPFAADILIDMERAQRQLCNRLEQSGIQVLTINLYDLSIEILKKEGDFEWFVESERNLSKAKLKEELQNILDVKSAVIPAIARKMMEANFDVLFLSGVGEVFPYIRSHNVLNNLQSTAKDKPTVMFFPGKYNYSPELGASLVLFDRLHDDRYYRAFNIFHCEA